MRFSDQCSGGMEGEDSKIVDSLSAWPTNTELCTDGPVYLEDANVNSSGREGRWMPS